MPGREGDGQAGRQAGRKFVIVAQAVENYLIPMQTPDRQDPQPARPVTGTWRAELWTGNLVTPAGENPVSVEEGIGARQAAEQEGQDLDGPFAGLTGPGIECPPHLGRVRGGRQRRQTPACSLVLHACREEPWRSPADPTPSEPCLPVVVKTHAVRPQPLVTREPHPRLAGKPPHQAVVPNCFPAQLILSLSQTTACKQKLLGI